MGFKHKTVLVSGGASGIGLAIATAFSRRGARVIILDNDGAALEATLRQLPHAEGVCADVAQGDALRARIEALLAQQPVDILINSAGIAATCAFVDTNVDLLDAMYAINLRGTFILAQCVARALLAQGRPGCIINIGSVSGGRGNAGRAAYGALKAGVASLTTVMAVELAGRGVRVNAIAPGSVETPLVRGAHPPRVRAAWLAALPLPRYAAADEIAQAALFLASDEASYIHGHILNVDGGFTAAGILQH